MFVAKKDLENSLKDLLANKKTMEKNTGKESDLVDGAKRGMGLFVGYKAFEYGIKGRCKVAEAYGYSCPF